MATKPQFAFTIQPTGSDDALVLCLRPQMAPEENIDRMPCEIVLVIDISGSMQVEASPPDGGEETGLSILDLTKHAAKTIIASLHDDDKLAIVTFSNKARVVHNLTSMSSSAKKTAVERIEALQVEQATNLWAGIREGLKQFGDSANDMSRTRSMFVLTDGKPNHMCPAKGYIPALKPLLEQSEKSGHAPIQINTFGFGYDIRSGLLHSIAESSGGNYGFIPDCGMIGTVFVHAVANLFSTCATNATLRLEVSSKCEITIGGGLSTTIEHWGYIQKVSVPLGSLLYGQPRDIVLRYKSSKPTDPNIIADLRYFANGSFVTERLVSADDDDMLYPLSPASSLYHVSRARICELLNSLFPTGSDGERRALPFESLETIKDQLNAVVSRISKHSAYRDELVQSLFSDVAGEVPAGQISLALSSEEYYNRWGKHYLPSILSAHQKQYCNSFKDPGPLQYGKHSELFIKARDQLNEIFDDMEIKPTAPVIADIPPGQLHGYSFSSLSGSSRSYSARSPPPKSRGRRFNLSSNECFAGDCAIDMGNGTRRAVSMLRLGDTVQSQNGPRKVEAILKTNVNNVPMLRIGDLVITAWHPVYHTCAWRFPANVSKDTLLYMGSIYSLLLEPSQDPSQHTVAVGGVVCTTLGHGILDKARTQDVRGHEFYGNYGRIERWLESMPKDGHGIHVNGSTPGTPFSERTNDCLGPAHSENDREHYLREVSAVAMGI